jgi:hypothetical protein
MMGSSLGKDQGRCKRRGLHILDGAGETLVLLGIVVLQTDLEVHCLQKLPLLVLIQRRFVKKEQDYGHNFINCQKQCKGFAFI